MVFKNKVSNLKLTNFNKIIGTSNSKILKELTISGGLISDRIISSNEIIDCADCIIAPGFIDPQVNGLDECNFWELDNLSFSMIDQMRLKLTSCGVVAFCPTLITAPKDKIIKSIDFINSYISQASVDVGARILGIHIEGLFISKYGVHQEKYIQKELTVANIKPFVKKNVLIFTLAPELDLTGAAIDFLKTNGILVSIGHSDANYRQGDLVIKKYGLKTVTHMFNAMRGVPGFLHRRENSSFGVEILRSKIEDETKIDPENDGILLAILKNKEVLCMVIADGLHVGKSVLSVLKENRGIDKFALVSDLVSKDFYDSSKAKGDLGGGQLALDKCVSNLVEWNIADIEESLLFASRPISKQLKIAEELGLGMIKLGNIANLVIWDAKKNAVKGTIIGENLFLNY